MNICSVSLWTSVQMEDVGKHHDCYDATHEVNAARHSAVNALESTITKASTGTKRWKLRAKETMTKNKNGG